MRSLRRATAWISPGSPRTTRPSHTASVSAFLNDRITVRSITSLVIAVQDRSASPSGRPVRISTSRRAFAGLDAKRTGPTLQLFECRRRRSRPAPQATSRQNPTPGESHRQVSQGCAYLRTAVARPGGDAEATTPIPSRTPSGCRRFQWKASDTENQQLLIFIALSTASDTTSVAFGPTRI